MTKTKNISINDPIHGQIDIEPLAMAVIEHSYFQRLRRVKALGFLDRVFPSAKHSRFEHSIGAYHITSLLIESITKIHKELNQEYQWLESSEYISLANEEFQTVFNPDIIEKVKIAALLHDVGHGPFSHASESIMPSIQDLINANPSMSTFIKEALEKKKKKNIEKGKGQQADHEDYTILIIDSLLKELKWNEKDIQMVCAIKSEHVQHSDVDTNKICKLFRMLVDGELDSDRMDYLLRDSFYCGVPYGNYDLKRLKEGLCIVKHRKNNQYKFGIMRKSLSAFEDFLFSRYQMHVQIYTHKVDACCNKMFEVLAGIKGIDGKQQFLPSELLEYIKLDDESFLNSPVASVELVEMIKNRKLWKLGHENFGNDKSLEQVIEDKFLKSISKDRVAIYKSEKAIKKPDLLEFPVICKSFLKNKLVSDNMNTISDLISHYNGNFSVRRVFYHPGDEAIVNKIFEDVSRTVSLNNMIAEKEKEIDELEKVDFSHKNAGGNS